MRKLFLNNSKNFNIEKNSMETVEFIHRDKKNGRVRQEEEKEK